MIIIFFLLLILSLSLTVVASDLRRSSGQ